MDNKIGIIGGGVLRGAVAAAMGAGLVDPSGVPVTVEPPPPTPEEIQEKARHALAVGRALSAGSLQVFDFGARYDDKGNKLDGLVVMPDTPKRVQDRAGRDYLFSGSKLLRARPKVAGGKKARRRAKRAAEGRV